MPRGFDPQAYVAQLVFAPAEDGESVPVSLLYKRGAKVDGSAPLFITGYGAYGYAAEASFATNRFSLVDRGFVFAIAHVRGAPTKAGVGTRTESSARSRTHSAISSSPSAF